MRRLLLLLLLPALVLAEDKGAPAKAEKKPKKKTAGEVDIPDPGPPLRDSSVARREVARFQKAWKEANTQEKRVKALTRLGNINHAEVAKAASKYARDKDHVVAVAAIVALGRQSEAKDKASRTLLGVLKREKRPHILCAALVGLGRLGCDDKNAIKAATKYFKRDTKETHKAATRYFGYIKYKPAFRMIAEKLDEPVAKNPNDPNNPPASWWKERWFEWDSNVKYTRWALAQIVEGETFESMEEAKAWAEAEGAKHGVEW